MDYILKPSHPVSVTIITLVIHRELVCALYALIKDSLALIHRPQLHRVEVHLSMATLGTRLLNRHMTITICITSAVAFACVLGPLCLSTGRRLCYDSGPPVLALKVHLQVTVLTAYFIIIGWRIKNSTTAVTKWPTHPY